MKVQILSDLHLEFGSSNFDFGDIDLLILAGDVHIGEKGYDWIKEEIKNIPVLYVLGNHEYYKSSYPKLLNRLLEKSAGSNIHILENDSITIEGVKFHGTTLWTNFELFGDPKIAGYTCQQNMSDFRLIRIDPGYSKLRSLDANRIHYRSLNWLRKSLNESEAKTNVVISHHAPSPRSIPLHYKDELVSAGYASNLEEFILDTKPSYWIHGHVHEPFDYYIGQTRIICNPHGYIHEPYNGYNSKLVLDIFA